MRELARSLAWTLAVGAFALLLAMFHGAGLEHADGPWAWLPFIVFWPQYVLATMHGAWAESLRVPALFVAQFLYYLILVVTVRRLRRGKSRWRLRRASQ